jgi:hypothetical protein
VGQRLEASITLPGAVGRGGRRASQDQDPTRTVPRLSAFLLLVLGLVGRGATLINTELHSRTKHYTPNNMVKRVTELITSIKSNADTEDNSLSDVEMDGNQRNMLSRVSQMYDINGDGELDEAERAMRNLDTTGRGYLTNEKIYELMNE